MPVLPNATGGRLTHFSRQASADLATFASVVLADDRPAFRVLPADQVGSPESAADVNAARRDDVTPVDDVDPLDVVDPVDLLDPFEPADRFELVEWLTPTPEHAVGQVREPFIDQFRELAGPGSRGLAEKAWEQWEDALLRGQGIDHARHRAEASVTGKRTGVPAYARLWLSPWQLRRAAWSASRTARDAS